MYENETKVKITEEDVRRGGVIFRTDYNKGAIIAQVIGSLILSVLSLIFFVNYLSPMQNSIWDTTRYTSEQRMKTIFLLLGILFFILDIITQIKIFQLRKNFISVNEKGVYGCAGKYAYFATQSFVIPKDQITQVYANGNSVYIESGENAYKCAVIDPHNSAGIINAVLAEGSKGLDTFKKQAGRFSSFLWTCTKCSYTNSSTDAKCKICGEAKSN